MLNYAHPEVLVDSQWLVEHLEDPNIRIIEMDVDSQSYEKGHIRGSIFWSIFEILQPDMRINFDVDSISKLLSRSGITKEMTVVASHGENVGSSACLFWFLKVIGHQNIRVLNGGRKKWKQEGSPLTTDSTTVKPTQYHIQSIDHSLRALLAEVKDSIGKKDCVLLDVRTPQEYQGEIYLQEPPKENERGGHIPGAVNLYYEISHNDDDTFKSADELEKIFADVGVTKDKTIIPYCAVGGRSGHMWFVLKYLLGYPHVKNYDGSWNEWSQLEDSLVETFN